MDDMVKSDLQVASFPQNLNSKSPFFDLAELPVHEQPFFATDVLLTEDFDGYFKCLTHWTQTEKERGVHREYERSVLTFRLDLRMGFSTHYPRHGTQSA